MRVHPSSLTLDDHPFIPFSLQSVSASFSPSGPLFFVCPFGGICSLDMNGVFAKVCMLFKGHDDLLQVRPIGLISLTSPRDVPI